MSGECEDCGKHTLECNCETNLQVGFKFRMPCGESLEIRSSKPINGLDHEIDKEIIGIVFLIFWNGKSLPWSTSTQVEAMSIALGCQYGANEVYKKYMSNN